MSVHKSTSKTSIKRLSRQVAIAALIAGGVIQPSMLPAFAAGTAADTPITNQATANYKDPSGTPLTATSNTVQILVAEVAGVTATPVGSVDENGGALQSGDAVHFDFQVTNTGNKATDIHIPVPSGAALQNLTLDPTTPVEYSTDGGVTFNPLPANGIIPGVAPDAKVIVRVNGNVPTGLVPGDAVSVTLGDTAPNDNTPATQNQPDSADTSQAANEIYTSGGTPINGQREASAAPQPLIFANQNKPLALAQVSKIVASSKANNTAVLNDDEITYRLGLDVKNSSPSSTFTPAALEGTDIKLDGVQTSRILVSDRLPAGTKLQAINFGALPAGWQAVYAEDAATSGQSAVVAPGVTPTEWKTLTSANLATAANTATRVGFVYQGVLQPGTNVTPFELTVNTSPSPASGSLNIANMAQVFGQTVGDPNNVIVYDESGDSNPNNFDGSTLPGPDGTKYDPANNPKNASGVIDPLTDGVDTGNNNTGSGPGGEASVVTIVPISAQILNGPLGAPTAVGSVDSNNDFSGVAMPVLAGTETTSPGSASIPAAAVTFKNTVNNPSPTASLANVTLQPISPTVAANNDSDTTSADPSRYGTMPPAGTTVTVFYDPDGVPNSGDERTAIYTSNGTDYALTQSLTGNTPDATPTPVNVGTLAPGQSVNYQTTVALPGNQPVLTAFPVAMVAFPDDNVLSGVGNGFTGETVNNISLNKVYTGYMQMVKEARLIDADGTTVLDPTTGTTPAAGQGWTTAFGPNVTLRPGQFIEYRMSYTNIADAAPVGGAGNAALVANDFTVTDDGTLAPSTWAAITTHQQDTVATKGSVKYTNGSTLIGTTDPIDGYTVTKYENVVGPVNPAEAGTFQFRRKVN